jgi:hypothetical protein
MKFSTILSLLTVAATGLATSASIPLLEKTDPWDFVNLDIDGVLRSWSVNGTVLDAVPLDPDQIAVFISIREGIVDIQRTINEKTTFANINRLDVPASELFNPPETVRPTIEIADAKSLRVADNGEIPVAGSKQLEARACVLAYCSGPNYECVIYVGCEACYKSVCFGLMESG